MIKRSGEGETRWDMERPADRKFFHDRRDEAKKVQVSFVMAPETLERVDAVRTGGESRASAFRRIIDVGLPAVERRASLMRAPQARLAPVAEEENER